MSFLTKLALRSPSVTVLLAILVIGGGIFTYNRLQVELFPEIEFPLVSIITVYPSANPQAVVRDVTAPIENAIAGVNGLKDVQSVSSESLSFIMANFEFGTDMSAAESTIDNRMGGLSFPTAVKEPRVVRLNPDQFPVLQLSMIGDRDITELQEIVDSMVRPLIASVDGVYSVDVTGGFNEQIYVTVDSEKSTNLGVSMFQIASALQDNNIRFPAGVITEGESSFPVLTSFSFDSLEDIRNLTVGVTGNSPRNSAKDIIGGMRPVLLSDVAQVDIDLEQITSISRTNGVPSLGIAVIKEPDANTVEVTNEVLSELDSMMGLPSDVEIITIINDGPEIQSQINTLEREAFFGFLCAVSVVFVFLLTLRPTIFRGLRLTLRPTVVIGLSIPLSILSGIVLMGIQGMTLNFMTLGGLAISVGRVVDDSIVVLENVYRHIQRGENRVVAALEATKEVAPAITAATLSTIVVFIPLGFIQGLVGSFFFPFAVTVSFALVASLFVALTVIPVLGAMLLRVGDYSDEISAVEGDSETDTWMQKLYTPILIWSLRHKLITILSTIGIMVLSLGLLFLIPINLFPSGGERFIAINLTLPPGSSIDRTMAEVEQIESVLEKMSVQGNIDIYLVTAGSSEDALAQGPGMGVGGSNAATFFAKLTETAPEQLIETIRDELSSVGGRSISVTELSDGPPTSGLEVVVTGENYDDITKVAQQLSAQFQGVAGITNVSSNVSESRDEVVIEVNSTAAASLGLTAKLVALQVNQFVTGMTLTQISIDGVPRNLVLRGDPSDVDKIDKLQNIAINGPMGSAPLGEVADVKIEKGPVTISRTNSKRSASISGDIVSDDTQAVGVEVQKVIDELATPPGVKITSGGVFSQIAEGFQDIFMAMIIGLVFVYLVMVASLGGLRNPFVIMTSLPLALIGTLLALAVTGRSLGLPAMMGVLLLIGIVVTNAVVLIGFVEQLRNRGLTLHEALVQGGRVRLRPIFMTAFTTSFALLPMAVFVSDEGGLLGAELATVVIGGLMTSTFLTLIVVPVVYFLMHQSIPSLLRLLFKFSSADKDQIETA